MGYRWKTWMSEVMSRLEVGRRVVGDSDESPLLQTFDYRQLIG